MLLKANELIEFKKKIIIIPSFIKSSASNDIDLNFRVYYDCGNGYLSPLDDSDTYLFAKKIKEQGYKEDYNLFELSSENEIIIRSIKNIKQINNEQNRIDFIKKIYDFGKRIDVPLFIKTVDGYFFMNELKFENNPKRENFMAPFCMVDFEKSLLNSIYGENFKRKN